MRGEISRSGSPKDQKCPERARAGLNERDPPLGFPDGLTAPQGQPRVAITTASVFRLLDTYSDPDRSFQTGASNIGSWVVTSNSVDLISTYWNAPSGGNSVDLDGFEYRRLNADVRSRCSRDDLPI